MAEKYSRYHTVTGGLWDAYKFFKKNNPDTTITRKQYVAVCHDFNKRISHSVLTESTEFRVLYGLGCLRIKSFKYAIQLTPDGKIDTQKNSVDWTKTKELWAMQYPGKTAAELHEIKDKKLVIHLNEHSNGYIMKWYWDHRTCNVQNHTLYVFKPVKGGVTKDGYYYGRRGLAAWVKSEDRTNEFYQ